MTKLVKTGRKPGALAPKGGVGKGRGGKENPKSSQPPRKNSGAWKDEFREKFKFKSKFKFGQQSQSQSLSTLSSLEAQEKKAIRI